MFGYLRTQLWNLFSKDQRRKWTNDIWMADAHGTWLVTTLSLQALPKVQNDGDVSFRGNSKRKIIRIGNVGKNSFAIIESVFN